MLVTRLDDAASALGRFHQHLQPGGTVMIPLLLPWKEDVATNPSPPEQWRLRRESVRPEDHATIRCWERATYDFDTQLKASHLRFEIVRDVQVLSTEERRMSLRWHTQEQFSEMLQTAGFKNVRIVRGHSDRPAGPEDGSFTFIATRL